MTSDKFTTSGFTRVYSLLFGETRGGGSEYASLVRFLHKGDQPQIARIDACAKFSFDIFDLSVIYLDIVYLHILSESLSRTERADSDDISCHSDVLQFVSGILSGGNL